MLKPICRACQRFFRPKKTGYYFTEAFPVGNGAQPGTAEPENWKPYKVWCGDLWECQGCGAQIISGVGSAPVGVQHEDGFDDMRRALRADQFTVNDC